MIMSEQEMKMVQEMAENQEEPPLRYIWRDSDEPVDDVPPIPAVHLGRPDEAEQIKTAIQSWGMFQVYIILTIILILFIDVSHKKNFKL